MIGDILQPTHLLVILLVALLVLGPKRLPEVGRSLGKGLRDFRGAMAGIEEHTSNLLGTDDPEEASGNSADSLQPPVPAATVPAEVEAVGPTPAPPTPAATGPVETLDSPPTQSPQPDPSEFVD